MTDINFISLALRHIDLHCHTSNHTFLNVQSITCISSTIKQIITYPPDNSFTCSHYCFDIAFTLFAQFCAFSLLLTA